MQYHLRTRPTSATSGERRGAAGAGPRVSLRATGRRVVGPSGRRWAARALLILLASTVSLTLAAGPAAAHTALSGSQPGPSASVARTPEVVVLTFTAPAIALGTQVSVAGPAGEAALGTPQLLDNQVRQPLQPGSPAGRYTVLWRITSADGHSLSESFTFTSGSAAAGQLTTTAPPPLSSLDRGLPAAAWSWLVAALIALFVVCAALALGRRAAAEPEPDEDSLQVGTAD